MIRPGHALAAVVTAAAVSVLLFSAFFTHARGPLDSVLTYRSYLGRGSGSGADAAVHVHPWNYYLGLLIYTRFPSGPVWTEGFVVALAVVGAAAGLLGYLPAGASRRFVRFLSVYTLLIFALYSAIPYKTPWLVLTPLHGIVLLAGVGAAAVVRAARPWPVRALACLALSAGVANQAVQSHRAEGRFRADRRNPWVYAHSSVDVLRLAHRAEDVAAISPRGHDLLVRVVTDYPWPLPWYLRRFPRVGYWEQIPPDTERDTSMFVVSQELAPELDARLKGAYHVEWFGMRPGVLVLAYTRQDLWDRLVAGGLGIEDISVGENPAARGTIGRLEFETDARLK